MSAPAGCGGKRALCGRRQTPGDHNHNLTNAGAEVQVMYRSPDAVRPLVTAANTLPVGLLLHLTSHYAIYIQSTINPAI